jgi:glutaredoxin-like protein NrdH
MEFITVYTEPAFVHAMPTFPALDTAKAAYTAVSTSRKLCLMRHPDSGEYLQAPVVYAGPDHHFAGFKPDRLQALANLGAA